jgi:hypothetical protein
MSLSDQDMQEAVEAVEKAVGARELAKVLSLLALLVPKHKY